MLLFAGHMWIAPFIGYIITLFVTLCGVQYHINIFKYPFYTSIPLTLAVYIPLSIVILLPLDYVSHNSSTENGMVDETLWFALKDHVILMLWKSNYWSTFILTWLMLPVLQEYYSSGHFKPLSKLKLALRNNLRYQAVIAAVSVLGLVYLLLEVGLTWQHVKLMIIAATHIYALVIALWLMSHGLISIPRNRWIAANNMTNLNHYYLQLPGKVDTLEDTKISLKEDILQILILVRNFTTTSVEDLRFRDWILKLNNSIPMELRGVMERQLESSGSNAVNITRDQLTEQFMIKLTKAFNLNLWKLTGHESEVGVLVAKIMDLEDVTATGNNYSGGSSGDSSPPPSTFGVFRNDYTYRTLFTPHQRFVYLRYVNPIVNRLVSIFLFAFSFAIIESEFLHSTRLSLIQQLLFSNGIHNSDILLLLITSITFSYMLFASLNSLTRLKIFNMYHLVPHNSDPVSASFYATYIARLTIPLSYNFITLFISRASIFETWYGELIQLDRAGIFNILNNWLPRLILIPIVLTVFNVYDKIKQKLGLNSEYYDSWVYDEEDQPTGGANAELLQNKRKDLIVTEAKKIVHREWLKKQQQRMSQEGPLRPFNLATAANMNYENNLQNFNQLLANRIEYRDEPASTASSPNISSAEFAPSNTSGGYGEFGVGDVWNRLGGALAGIRNNVVSRFGGNNLQSYRDDPELIHNFEYDNDNLVL